MVSSRSWVWVIWWLIIGLYIILHYLLFMITHRKVFPATPLWSRGLRTLSTVHDNPPESVPATPLWSRGLRTLSHVCIKSPEICRDMIIDILVINWLVALEWHLQIVDQLMVTVRWFKIGIWIKFDWLFWTSWCLSIDLDEMFVCWQGGCGFSGDSIHQQL